MDLPAARTEDFAVLHSRNASVLKAGPEIIVSILHMDFNADHLMKVAQIMDIAIYLQEIAFV